MNSKPKKGVKGWLKELGTMFVLMSVISVAVNAYLTRDMPSGQAPHIQGHTLNGKNLDVQQLSYEKPVIVYFWATWCGVCRFVSPMIDHLAQSNSEQKRYVLSVALSSGTDARVQQYINAKAYQFPVINDQSGQLSRAWNISVTPTAVIIEDGEIRSISTGITAAISVWFRSLFM